jgi:hypothetical protein
MRLREQGNNACERTMKTKMLVLVALLGATAMSASAGVRFGISIGLPVMVVSPSVVYAPPPVAVVETIPACPPAGYVWVPGYWSYYPTGLVWVRGAWCYRPVHVEYRHWDRGRDHDRRDRDRW